MGEKKPLVLPMLRAQPRGGEPINEEAFQEAVTVVRGLSGVMWFGNMTPGAALATTLSGDYQSQSDFISFLLPRSEHERWAWETLGAIAQWYLMCPYDPMPDELAEWVVGTLDGRNPKPENGKRKYANRDIMVAQAVLFIRQMYHLKPTRGAATLKDACVKGGSACDVVAVAMGLSYKNVERIWLEWGSYATRMQKRSEAFTSYWW
ncbi:MAG: hypothetical protein OXS50_02005 [Gammaproteobacteria bacterium]|nr:hypothetical protein [Gammaproteobacteria bacterium]